MLEELLERVRTEVGPDARIVAANRVRKGGVGGFFAKQAFEVLVEADDTAAAAATVATGRTAAGVHPATPCPLRPARRSARWPRRHHPRARRRGERRRAQQRHRPRRGAQRLHRDARLRAGARPVQPRSTRRPRSSASRRTGCRQPRTGLRHRPPRDEPLRAARPRLRPRSLPTRCPPNRPSPPAAPATTSTCATIRSERHTSRRSSRAAGGSSNRPRASSTATRPDCRASASPRSSPARRARERR